MQKHQSEFEEIHISIAKLRKEIKYNKKRKAAECEKILNANNIKTYKITYHGTIQPKLKFFIKKTDKEKAIELLSFNPNEQRIKEKNLVSMIELTKRLGIQKHTLWFHIKTRKIPFELINIGGLSTAFFEQEQIPKLEEYASKHFEQKRKIKEGVKHCTKCNQDKFLTEFYKNKTKSRGVSTYCKKCANTLTSEYQRKRGQQKREQKKQQQLEYLGSVIDSKYQTLILNILKKRIRFLLKDYVTDIEVPKNLKNIKQFQTRDKVKYEGKWYWNKLELEQAREEVLKNNCWHCGKEYQKKDLRGKNFCSDSCKREYELKWSRNKSRERRKDEDYRIQESIKAKIKAKQARGSVEGKLKSLVLNSRVSAKKKQLKHNLDKEFLFNLYEQQNGKCALTGKEFSFKLKKDNKNIAKNPHVMSLDRIDSSKGYVKDNVRLVTWQVNTALNIWNDREFDNMVKDYVDFQNFKNFLEGENN